MATWEADQHTTLTTPSLCSPTLDGHLGTPLPLSPSQFEPDLPNISTLSSELFCFGPEPFGLACLLADLPSNHQMLTSCSTIKFPTFPPPDSLIHTFMEVVAV